MDEEDLAAVIIEEQDAVVLSYDASVTTGNDYDDRWCIVGRFLTERSIDFDAMQHMLAWGREVPTAPVNTPTSEVQRSQLVSAGAGTVGFLKSPMIVEDNMGQCDIPINVETDFMEAATDQEFSENIAKDNDCLDTKRRRTESGLFDGPNELDEDGEINKAVMGSKNMSFDIVIQNQPKIIFLCETLSNRSPMEKARVSLGYDGMMVVDVQGRSALIALLWKEEDEVSVLGFSTNYIDVKVPVEGMVVWRFTGMYGKPNRSHRIATWNLLRSLAANSNLCVMGDLNNVCSHEDNRGGNRYPEFLIQGFQQALNDSCFQDMELCGYPFTWERGRGTSHWVEIRLDRCLANLS
uniref:Endonuclease/exonuclease/phosphatase domain-containing protein n=1 Tax=Cannabis sativa TaxID=3483 RepID=A0A803Q9V8_CANSA